MEVFALSSPTVSVIMIIPTVFFVVLFLATVVSAKIRHAPVMTIINIIENEKTRAVK